MPDTEAPKRLIMLDGLELCCADIAIQVLVAQLEVFCIKNFWKASKFVSSFDK